MISYLTVVQLVFACFSGLLVFTIARWCSHKLGPTVFNHSRQRLSCWPQPTPGIWFLFVPFVRPAERLARPSPRLARQLALGGVSFTHDDREFSVFRNTMSLFSASLAAVLGLALLLFGGFPGAVIVGMPFAAGVLVFVMLTARVSDRHKRIQRQVSRGFPNFLDVLSLTLESGKNFQSALQMATQQLPRLGSSAVLRIQLLELVRDALASGSKISALQGFAERIAIPEVIQFTAAVIAAERQGVSVAALLRRQAEQLRTSQALAAERHAMKLPVKLLAPLAVCIFPCTFLVLAFPLATRLSGSGLF
jgi:tight adherence protein C